MKHAQSMTWRRFLTTAFALCVLALSACTGQDDPGSVATDTTTVTSPPETAAPPPPIEEAPSAPVGLLVVATHNGSVELAWDDSRDESVTGYEITRVTSGGDTEVFTSPVSSFVDTGLEDGVIFTYKVAAVAPGGTSAGSEPVSARVGVDDNPPSRPGLPKAVEVAGGAQLEWRESRDFSGVEKYIVTRTLAGTATEIETVEANLADDVEPGQIVTYTVRAVDTSGNESESSRAVTFLSGVPSDQVVVVVSAIGEPSETPETQRLQTELLDAGYVVSWFEDDVFDSNVTASDDLVLLLGDIEAQGFDWNLFGTDAAVIALKSVFLQASGITENPPKLDGLAQLDYTPPGGQAREVAMTTTPKPRNVPYIPAIEQLPDFQVWATTTWSAENAVAGLIPAGGELANEKPSPGCRAFFPGNRESLAEQTNDAWELLVEFVDDIASICR